MPSTTAPVFAPVLSLGRRVQATEGAGALTGTFAVAAAATTAGGPTLRPELLSPAIFAADRMLVADRDLMDLKVTQLKEELKERGEKRTGNKAWLRRRLHGAMLRAHLAAQAAAAGGAAAQ